MFDETSVGAATEKKGLVGLKMRRFKKNTGNTQRGGGGDHNNNNNNNDDNDNDDDKNS